jgi:pimeloyl-ACP methyl ester carboxylesterase
MAMRPFIEGTGPSVVMLGGGIAGAAAFAPHAAELATRFRVIRLQTLNVECAENQAALPPGYSIRCESRAMGATLDAVAPAERLDIIGHSLGALVALDFALDHQARVRTLVLSEPPAFWVVPQDEFRAALDMQHMTTLVRYFSPTHEPTDSQLVAFRRALGDCDTNAPAAGDTRRPRWLSARRCLRGLSAVPDHTDDVERLKSFRRPVLLIMGASSPRFHRRINELLATHLPIVETMELPGGHWAVHTARTAFLMRCVHFWLTHECALLDPPPRRGGIPP